MEMRPKPDEYAQYYARYVSLVPEGDILDLLERQRTDLARLGAAVPADREQFRYMPGKWSVREVIGHLIDGERVFGYRAFCISRGEQAHLPSFDEKLYVGRSSYDRVRLADLIAEFTEVRNVNLAMFRRLEESRWTSTGIASDNRVSVRALAYIMAGHLRHHTAVLHERYGLPADR
jgi:hypothetical protein